MPSTRCGGLTFTLHDRDTGTIINGPRSPEGLDQNNVTISAESASVVPRLRQARWTSAKVSAETAGCDASAPSVRPCNAQRERCGACAEDVAHDEHVALALLEPSADVLPEAIDAGRGRLDNL